MLGQLCADEKIASEGRGEVEVRAQIEIVKVGREFRPADHVVREVWRNAGHGCRTWELLPCIGRVVFSYVDRFWSGRFRLDPARFEARTALGVCRRLTLCRRFFLRPVRLCLQRLETVSKLTRSEPGEHRLELIW